MTIHKKEGRIRRKETQILGWYAVQRAYVADWFKIASERMHPQSKTAKDDADESKDESKDGSEQDENGDDGGNAEADNTNKLEEAVRESHGILAKATTVFPFTPFPDTIVIDRHKLTIVRRHLLTEQALSVPIENIKNVQADMGPIFGTITVISDQFVNSEQRLEYLRRRDVDKIQKLVQGIVMATKDKIDISEVDPKRLQSMLTELGEGHTRDI